MTESALIEDKVQPAPAATGLIPFAVSLAFILLLFYAPFLMKRETFFFEDSTKFFEPLCSFIGNAMRNGRLPLWNPYAYCGMPQIAVSSPGICSPFSWLLIFLDYSQSLAVTLIACQCAAGIGTFLLITSFRWGWAPAALAGFIVSMSGYMFSLSSNYTLVVSGAFFPLALWSVRMIRTTPSQQFNSVSPLILVFSVFLMVSGGRPEIWLPSVLLIVIFSVSNYGDGKVFSFSSKEQAAFKYVSIALLLSAPSLIPTAEWLPLSRRSEGLPSSESLLFSANWYSYLDMFFSHPLGDLQSRVSEYRILVQPKNMGPYFGSAFIGSISLCFCMMGLRRGKRLYWMLLLLTILSVLVSLGENIWFMRILFEQIPALGMFRFPSKYLFFVVFCIAVFAARGLRDYLNGSANLVPAFIFCLLALSSGLFLQAAPQNILPFYAKEIVSQDLLLSAQRLISSSFLETSVATVVVLLLLHFCSFHHRMLAASFAVLCIIIGMNEHADAFYRDGAPADYYCKKSSVGARLGAVDKELTQKFARYAPFYLEGFSIPKNFADANAHKATVRGFEYGRELLRPFTNIDANLPSSFGFEGAMTGEYFYLFLNEYLNSSQVVPLIKGSMSVTHDDAAVSRLMQITATSSIVTQSYRCVPRQGIQSTEVLPELDTKFFQTVIDDRSNNVRIYKLIQPLPRAYLSHCWKVFSERDRVIRALVSDQSFDPCTTTLIENLNQTNLIDKTIGSKFEPVTINEPVPEEINIEATCSEPSLLVLADQYYPGWQVSVDGAECPILRCNGFMKGVALEAGKHSVHFKYVPKSFWGGVAIAILAGVWLLILLLQERKKAKS